jgi:hypothetical protein
LAANEQHDSRVHLIAPLAFLDPLLARPALVVEGDDPLGRARQVGDDEANAGIKLARVPLDLGHHAARYLPGLRLITEAGVVPPDLVRRTANRALEQVADPQLQNLIGRQPDRVLEPFGLLELVDLRVREGGIGAEVAALDAPIPGHDLFQHLLPTVR